MTPKALSEYLALPLTEYQAENPARCALSDYSGQYVVEEGQIVALNLYGQTQQKAPSSWLHRLPKLRYLNLANCGLQSCDLSEVTPELQVLFLQDNTELTELQLPDAFPALLRADLSHCRLARVEWPESPVLEFLNVSRQEESSLATWQFDSACPRLYYCDLSYNRLEKFRLPAGFVNLGFLCLESNQLTKVKLRGGLPLLESLRLNNNQLRELPREWYEQLAHLDNLFLDDNPLGDHYTAQLEGKSPHETVQEVRRFLKDFESGKAEDNEVKLLIVGNGGAGKSNVYLRLTRQPFVPTWDSTHGVIIDSRAWPVESPRYQVQFWDFGGQDIYHATHRLFMQSSAVYLVVWNPKKEEESEREDLENDPVGVDKHFELPYWLDYVYRSSSSQNRRDYNSTEQSEAPVLLVQTRKKAYPAVTKPAVDRQFGRLFTHYWPSRAVESKPEEAAVLDSDGYSSLELDIEQAMREAKDKGRDVPKNHFRLRQLIREKQAAGVRLLTLEEFDALAAQAAAETQAFELHPHEILSNWLHKTGVVYYQKSKTGDRIILDQHWATEAIYAIFRRDEGHNYSAEIYNNGGFFTGADLRRYWNHPSEEDEVLFEQFMRNCELAYQVNRAEREEALPFAERRYCAPQLLPQAAPTDNRYLNGFRKRMVRQPQSFWHLRLYREFLHTGIINRLIIALHRPGDETAAMWRRGLYFTDEEGQQALIEVVDQQNIRVVVEKAAEEMLYSIWQEIHDLPALDQPDLLWVSADGQEERAVTEEQREQWGKHQDQPKPDQLVRFLHGLTSPIPAEEPVVTMDGKPVVKASPKKSGDGPWKICFLAAVQKEYDALAIKKEADEIENAINLMGDTFHPDPAGNYAPGSTVDAMDHRVNRYSPSVVHFAGHGEKSDDMFRLDENDDRTGLQTHNFEQCGIVLQRGDGAADFVTEADLAQLVARWQKTVTPREHPLLQLIVLNACHTAAVAQRISAHCGITVIGAKEQLPDAAAVIFAKAFYTKLQREGLGALSAAFEHATYAAKRANSRAHYVLFINGKQA
ncbi:MAG: COR domain-containing protein [Bacteroidota bacterium]